MALSSTAAADPIVVLPPAGRGALVTGEASPELLAVVGEVSGIGILGANDMTTLPQFGSIEGDRPELGRARVGLVAVHSRLPLAAVVRVDFSEGLRVDLDTDFDRPMAGVDRFIDEAQVWWRPAVWTELVLGRQKVPFSRFRQLDESLLSAGVTPFLTDRIAPDRRWGLGLYGDLGALSYAAGAYEDLDALEARTSPGDPSSNGGGIVAAHVEWTPRAPMGSDLSPTPTSDPWYDTTRVGVGLGFLYRTRTGNTVNADNTINHVQRFDISGNAQAQRGRYGALAEVIIAKQGADLIVDVAGEASVAIVDRVMTFGRAETDAQTESWSSGVGVSYFVTADRRNRVTLYGWLRRETGASSIERDGVIAQLQASL